MSNTITNNAAPLSATSMTATRVNQKKEEEKKLQGVLTEEQLKQLDKILEENKTDSLKRNQELGKDQFMQILLRQLSHQNPLQPMEDKEFIAQMAQFSSLESLQSLNKNFKGLGEEVGKIKELITDYRAKDKELEATVKSIAENIAEINKAIKENKAFKAYGD